MDLTTVIEFAYEYFVLLFFGALGLVYYLVIR